MKYFIPIFAGLVITFGGGALLASAQGYVPLVTLPGVTDAGTPVNIGDYLAGMMKFLVALSGALAILMVIIGGMQYVVAGINPSAKSDARERIVNAFIGLALVLASYLILNSINPKLVKFSLLLPQVTGPAVTTPVAGAPGAPTTTTAGAPWPSDAPERAELGASPYNVSVNRSPGCTTVGQPSCTSLAGLGNSVKQGLKTLAILCGGGCRLMITGGTEYWLHGNRSTDLSLNKTAHKPGGNAVDLSIGYSSSLDSYIRSTGTIVSSGCTTGTRYKIGSAVYVDEVIAGNPPHWHICYY